MAARTSAGGRRPRQQQCNRRGCLGSAAPGNGCAGSVPGPRDVLPIAAATAAAAALEPGVLPRRRAAVHRGAAAGGIPRCAAAAAPGHCVCSAIHPPRARLGTARRCVPAHARPRSDWVSCGGGGGVEPLPVLWPRLVSQAVQPPILDPSRPVSEAVNPRMPRVQVTSHATHGLFPIPPLQHLLPDLRCSDDCREEVPSLPYSYIRIPFLSLAGKGSKPGR